jgi:signal transduction histidine kinase/CheY-like chemotaxis protein
MNPINLIKIKIKKEQDIVTARQKARLIASHLNFDSREQTAISTAVSEIARNCFVYAGGGDITFKVDIHKTPQIFIILIEDNGPGIKNIDQIMNGQYISSTGMGLGIIGSRRLMDFFDLNTVPEKGTKITIGKYIPLKIPGINSVDIKNISDILLKQPINSLYTELVSQNQELINALDEVKRRTEELEILNQELEETNRGVVALYAELDDKAEHLKMMNELKAKFLSNMSHEFKTPLNSILALSRLLIEGIDGKLNSEQSKQVSFIKKSAEDLFDLVNDLLDLAKVEAGKLEIKSTVFTVKDTFSALRGIMRPLLVNPKLNLIFEDADTIPPIFTDEGKVSQVLRNLISNAIKFTEAGEIVVKAKVSDDRSTIIFSVSDTGIGIDEKYQQFIFEEFTQVDSALQKHLRGTGLGLPLSKKLVNLLGGDVWLKSTPGIGSDFSFFIPASFVLSDKTDTSDLISEKTEFNNLLVFTDLEKAPYYKSFFSEAPFNPYYVHNMNDALEYLNLVKPSAIILNADFPDPSFVNRYNMITNKINNIPVIVSTTAKESDSPSLKGSGYWVKPLTLDKFHYFMNVIGNENFNKSFLIIDDDIVSRYLVKEVLPKEADKIEAQNGEIGLKAAREHKPYMIFLDLNMPGLNGFEVLNFLKDDQSLMNIPIIINTSKDLTESDLIDLTKDADAILSKKVISDDNAQSLLTDFLLRINAHI